MGHPVDRGAPLALLVSTGMTPHCSRGLGFSLEPLWRADVSVKRFNCIAIFFFIPLASRICVTTASSAKDL